MYPPPKPKRNKNQRVDSPLTFVTATDLSKLEDAIFEDSPEMRIRFLNIYSDLQRNEEDDLDTYLLKHASCKRQALSHCWHKLGWRPNKAATKVLNKNINPYLK